jgi:hypothetical protein
MAKPPPREEIAKRILDRADSTLSAFEAAMDDALEVLGGDMDPDDRAEREAMDELERDWEAKRWAEIVELSERNRGKE